MMTTTPMRASRNRRRGVMGVAFDVVSYQEAPRQWTAAGRVGRAGSVGSVAHFTLSMSNSRDVRPVRTANSSLTMCVPPGEYHAVLAQARVLEFQQSIRIVSNVPAGTVIDSSFSARHRRSM